MIHYQSKNYEECAYPPYRALFEILLHSLSLTNMYRKFVKS